MTLARPQAPDAGASANAPATDATRPYLNAPEKVESRYCSECGQRVADPDPTLREMTEELASEVLTGTASCERRSLHWFATRER